jgi:hypothetical protein
VRTNRTTVPASKALGEAHDVDVALHLRVAAITGKLDAGAGVEQFTNDPNDAGLEQFKGLENRNLVNGPMSNG